MPLPTVPDGTIVKIRFHGRDNDVTDIECDQYFGYVVGFVPNPGGVTVDQMLSLALASWAALWAPYQSSSFSWIDGRIDTLDTIVAVPPNRFRATYLWQWADAITPVPGAVAGDPLPPFCAFSIRKRTAYPGRGSQGHIRIPAVPESSCDGSVLDPAVLAAMATAFLANGALLDISNGGGNDFLRMGNMRGMRVNQLPGLTPSAYFVGADSLLCDPYVGTQITRKKDRHRA